MNQIKNKSATLTTLCITSAGRGSVWLDKKLFLMVIFEEGDLGWGKEDQEMFAFQFISLLFNFDYYG